LVASRDLLDLESPSLILDLEGRERRPQLRLVDVERLAQVRDPHRPAPGQEQALDRIADLAVPVSLDPVPPDQGRRRVRSLRGPAWVAHGETTRATAISPNTCDCRTRIRRRRMSSSIARNVTMISSRLAPSRKSASKATGSCARSRTVR